MNCPTCGAPVVVSTFKRPVRNFEPQRQFVRDDAPKIEPIPYTQDAMCDNNHELVFHNGKQLLPREHTGE